MNIEDDIYDDLVAQGAIELTSEMFDEMVDGMIEEGGNMDVAGSEEMMKNMLDVIYEDEPECQHCVDAQYNYSLCLPTNV